MSRLRVCLAPRQTDLSRRTSQDDAANSIPAESGTFCSPPSATNVSSQPTKRALPQVVSELERRLEETTPERQGEEDKSRIRGPTTTFQKFSHKRTTKKAEVAKDDSDRRAVKHKKCMVCKSEHANTEDAHRRQNEVKVDDQLCPMRRRNRQSIWNAGEYRIGV